MTSPAAKCRTISLTESVQQTRGKLVVDRAAGVIRNVKFLGTTSANRHGNEGVDGTDYTVEAIREALPQYESRQVFIDHPANRNARAERSVRDLAGCLKNCRVEDDGGYGDLHYLKGTPDGDKLATIAESMPEQIGMSHNADGKSRVDSKRRRAVIESIPVVRSVDIVTRPATTKSLYESQESGTVKTLKQILESFKLDKNAILVKLLEDEGMAMDAAPAAAPEAAGDWRGKLCEALCHIVQDAALDPAEVKAKVNAILKLVNEKEEPKEKVEGDPEPTETKESRELKAVRGVLTLCESEGYRPTAKEIGILSKLDASEQKELIGTFKGATAPATGLRRPGPRSNSIPTLESTNGNEPKTLKDAVKRCFPGANR